MRIEYGLDRYCLPKQIHIVPSEGEDPEILHNMASRLLIENPAIAFSDMAKAGKLNSYDDEEYEKLLAVVKRLNLLFIPPNSDKPVPQINLFDMVIQLLYEYMLNQHSESSRII